MSRVVPYVCRAIMAAWQGGGARAEGESGRLQRAPAPQATGQLHDARQAAPGSACRLAGTREERARLT
jgi:hypothetical protein